MSIVSFPGLGIENFEIDNVAFSIGEKFAVYWYGILITCGIIFAFLYTFYRAKNEKLNSDSIIDVGLWTVILGVIGARLYYVIFEFDYYLSISPDFWSLIKNIFDLRSGGLAIYGGIICGILGIIIASRIKKMNVFKLFDAIGPGVMMAQAIGRWGNFMNAEAHGGIVPEGHPLYFMRMGLYPNEDSIFHMQYYHPTFLYESLWNVIGFIIINIFYKKKKFNGQMACMYLAWYGFGRMFIEGLRTDSLYVGSIRVSQLVGLLCFLIFGGLLVAGLVYAKKREQDKEKYTRFAVIFDVDMELAPERLYHKITRKLKKAESEEPAAQAENEEDKNG